jgi:hypothetical protein
LSALALGSFGPLVWSEDEVIVLDPTLESEPMPAPAQHAPMPGGFDIGLDRLWLETAAFTRADSQAAGTGYAQAKMSARWRPNDTWEWQAGARFDGYIQTGARQAQSIQLDYGDTFVRYRDAKRRLTLGAQTVLWGRVDEMAPTDRLSVQDISRFILDELGERRRALPMLRWEEFTGSAKLDVILIPEFRAAELPDADSVWYPVDQERGMVLGIPSSPVLQALLAAGTVGDDARPGGGGGGLRFSQTLSGLDYALTAQRTRHSLPYYQLDSKVRQALLAGAGPQVAVAQGRECPTFEGRHPYTNVFGGDLGMVLGSATARFEAAWLSDVPVTTQDLRMETVNSMDWVAGIEFYPGDASTRLNLQLSGHHLLDSPKVLDETDVINLNGQVETEWAQGRWRTRLRMATDLNHNNVYVNPEIVWLGSHSQEIYGGVHYFSGEDGAFGNYFADNSNVALGWRMSY